MDLDRESEIANMLEAVQAPAWVLEVVQLAVEAPPEEAALWTESLALAFGRRANRVARERLDFGAFDRPV